MVHSGSASPMTTTKSASPHLTLPAAAPPLQVAPTAPPPGNTTDQELNQNPAKLIIRDFTSNSDFKPSTQNPADTETPVVTPAKALAPAPGTVNGRTSGRKRTPKACDCCGPHGAGHNVRTSGRGRGRGRARGRGRGGSNDVLETPRRKLGTQLTQIRTFDLTEMKEEEEEEEEEEDDDDEDDDDDDDDRNEMVDDVSIEWSGGKDGGDGGDGGEMEMRLSGVANRQGAAVRGRGSRGAGFSASKVEAESNKALAAARTTLVKKPLRNDHAEEGEQRNLLTVKAPFANGDTVNLSDTEQEDEEQKQGIVTVSKMENGVRPESPLDLDLDSDMQVDQTPETDSSSVSVTLSNGEIPTPSDEDLSAAHMDVEDPAQAEGAAPAPGAITVCSTQHRAALRDHWLYCRPGVWDRDQTEDELKEEEDGKTQDEERWEELIFMVHEFLENFYIKYGGFIPLSETDVLEHLRKTGNCDLSKRGLDVKEEMSRYRAALASAPVACFMVTYNKHTLSLEDLGTLEEQNWLNDQIINMYGELIMEATQQKVHFFNSFFHKQLVAKGYEGVKRWTKKVDLFSKWLLLIPIHLEIHWSLITVTMATKTISYYDSQGIVFRHTTDNILKYLLSEAREKNQTAFQKGWKITIIKGIPQQKNDSDCGVFVLEYGRCLSLKQPLKFSQEDMPRIRKRIYKELCDCRLQD